MNNIELPDIGLGTYQLDQEQTYRSVRWALKIDYRHIDTAALYKNEKQVRQAIRDSGIPRQQIFITTKILPKAILKPAIENSLHQLDLNYIDLILLHYPNARLNQTWEELTQLYSELYRSKQLNNQQLLKIITENRLNATTLLLKWALQNNIKIIPRSTNQKHIYTNFNLPSEFLSEYLMKCLDNLDSGFATHPQHIRPDFRKDF